MSPGKSKRGSTSLLLCPQAGQRTWEHSGYLVNIYEIFCNAFPRKGRKKWSEDIIWQEWMKPRFFSHSWNFDHAGCARLLALFPQTPTLFVDLCFFPFSSILCWPFATQFTFFILPFLCYFAWFCLSLSPKFFFWRKKKYILIA